jgi:hypothetical protein
VDESASIERGKETLVPPEDFRRPRRLSSELARDLATT